MVGCEISEGILAHAGKLHAAFPFSAWDELLNPPPPDMLLGLRHPRGTWQRGGIVGIRHVEKLWLDAGLEGGRVHALIFHSA